MFMVHGKHKKFFLSTHTSMIVGDPLHIRSPLIYIKDGQHVHEMTGGLFQQNFIFHDMTHTNETHTH
jgi:hypothetical protein